MADEDLDEGEGEQQLGEEGELGEEGKEKPPAEEPASSDSATAAPKLRSAIDTHILLELEDAEKQAMLASQIILKLKNRAVEFLNKGDLTEAEMKEFEQTNTDLKKQSYLFEEKIRRIHFLFSQSQMFDKIFSPPTAPALKHRADALPKVLFCGVTDEGMPKMVICDEKKKGKRQLCSPTTPDPCSVLK